jgi:hypothetical protein
VSVFSLPGAPKLDSQPSIKAIGFDQRPMIQSAATAARIPLQRVSAATPDDQWSEF